MEYDTRSYLRTATARNLQYNPSINLNVTSEENQNLSPAKKRLLHWHYRFGHRNMRAIQLMLRNAPFGTDKYLASSKIIFEERPQCDVCHYAKARRNTVHGKLTQSDPASEGDLKKNHLRPGASVSADHFESRIKGRTLTSFGRRMSEQYVGGCVFVDHMSSYIQVVHQLGFSSSETIRAKQTYEQHYLDHGIMVDTYLADNGVFKANAFINHIRDHAQRLRFCGVNAHHQNGVAERAIKTVSDISRAMMLHASVHWKDGIDSSLWPMSTTYAAYIHNHFPDEHGIAPADLFSGSQFPRHKLKDIHTWGCPVYVLDPTLQQGKKLPKWQPRSRKGVFVGFSSSHGSEVPLVLNPATGHISPQFHVVFDDSFSTVCSQQDIDTPPSFWNEFDLNEFLYQIPLDVDSPATLSNEWLTPQEREEKERTRVRALQLRSISQTIVPSLTQTSAPQPSTPTPLHILAEPRSTEPNYVDAVEWASDLPLNTSSTPPTPSGFLHLFLYLHFGGALEPT